MLEQRGLLIGHHGLEEGLVLARPQHGPFEKRNALVEDGEIAGDLDVMGDRIGQPDAIVGDPRPHALAGMGQPPMLIIALDELPAGGPQEMLADERRPGDRHRHPVLELVAESIGATRLVEGRARHDTAGERLIEQPAVQHHIHGGVGRLHLDGAEDVIPFLDHLFQGRVEIGAPVAHDQGDGLGPGRRLAEKEDDLRRGVGRQIDLGLQHGTGIHSRTGPIGERRVAGEGGGIVRPAVPPEEFRAVARPSLLPPAEIGEGDPRPEFGTPGVARQHDAAFRIDLGHHIRARGPARGPQDPFHIARHRQPPMALRIVADRQPGDLDRILQGDVLQELERDAVGGMLEAAIALAVAGDIGRGLLADGERRGSSRHRHSPRRADRWPRPADR